MSDGKRIFVFEFLENGRVFPAGSGGVAENG
jgi:hypothetical protein